MRALLAALLICCALPAHARVKIDRYAKATLPEVKLWVSLLNEYTPVPPAERLEFTVTVNGQIIRDEVDYETADELGEPMAMGIVVDARSATWWEAIKPSLSILLKDLPEESIAVGYRTRQEIDQVPEKGWAIEPAKLAPVLGEKSAAGSKARLGLALIKAIKRFPLRPGLSKEADDEGAPPWKDESACPDDRVLFVIADGDLGGSERFRSQNMRRIVRMARRRGLRIMGIGIDPAGAGAGDEEEITVDDQGNIIAVDGGPQAAFDHRQVLRVIARKTGGTYRAAITEAEIPKVLTQARDELRNRYILEFEADDLRRGELAEFAVTVQLPTGGANKARSFTARIDNEMGLLDRVADWISDLWEGLPWWALLIIYVVGGLIIVLVTLIIVVKKVRKRRKAADAAEKARAAALAARTPCAICGQMMMPEWTQCLFCAQEAAAVRPMRFRLTGRTGEFLGQALRFDREIITIGSDPRCDVCVMDRGVAVQHCGIRDRGGDEFILTDFNTDLGTWVNGERVAQVIIEEGDLLRVGETEFVFGIEAS